MMTEQSYRHIPLVDDGGSVVGFVTARDIIVYIAENFPAEVVNLPPELHQTPMRAEGG
jgi:CBS domain-containing protein